MELYRCLVDDFLIRYFQGVRKKDFKTKFEDFSPGRKGKREFLVEGKANDLLGRLYGFFESRVEVPRIRFGEGQTVETLISEEVLLFAKFLRGERGSWCPRVAVPN